MINKHYPSILIAAAFFLINLSCIYIPGYNINKKENKYMPEYHIFNQNGKKTFMPLTFATKGPIEHIFGVPISNAVGTIDLDNAITIMKFNNGGIDYNIVAKNFLSEVNGEFDYGFCNVYSDEEIAYTQTRWVVIANIRTGKVISPVITYEMNDYIPALRPLSVKDRKFLFLREGPGGGNGTNDYLHIMKIIDKDSINNEGALSAGFSPIGYKIPWHVHNNLIFTYNVSTNKIACSDLDLKPVSHPFMEIFNRNSGKFRKLKEFIIHPSLPFGIVVEIGKDFNLEEFKKKYPDTEESKKIEDSLWALEDIHALYLIRWDTQDEEKQFVPILADSLSLLPPINAKTYSGFQFSPDGSWLVFRDETRYRKFEAYEQYGSEEKPPDPQISPVFTALPIDSAAPLFFGEPLFLGRIMVNKAKPAMTAWATNPLSFVVSTEEYGLWKWDLGNAKKVKVIDTLKVVVPIE